MRKPLLAFLALCALTLLCCPAQAADVYVGVLADAPQTQNGDTEHRTIRAAFRHRNEWQALPHETGGAKNPDALRSGFPEVLAWSLCRGGRRAGTLHSRNDRQYRSWADIGSQRVEQPRLLSPSGARTMRFAGWRGEPVSEPLAAVSGGGCGDPENWKSGTVPQDLMPRLIQKLTREIAARKEEEDTFSRAPRPYSFAAPDVQARAAFRSDKGAWIVELSVFGKSKFACIEAEACNFGEVLFVDAAGNIRWLGSDLSFIDAGDYDRDGRAEILMMLQQYNLDGYVLFYNDMAGRRQFFWHYH